MIANVLERVRINGLPLPPALLIAMYEGRWRYPEPLRLRRVFREPPGTGVFFSLAAMREANARWIVEKNPAFFGRRDHQATPGDIAPELSLLLGELAPDCPFALDYREATERPKVVYLHSDGDQWITVAHDLEDLLRRLDLEEAKPRRGRQEP